LTDLKLFRTDFDKGCLCLAKLIHFLILFDELVARKFSAGQQVKDHPNISESTYKRKVKDGTLKPIKLHGSDRFYLKDLLAAYLESQQKGRI
jgi:hypothetical protein